MCVCVVYFILHTHPTRRWGTSAGELGARLDVLVGDALLAAAATTYLGAFTAPYRAQLVSAWEASARRLGVPASAAFSLAAVLSSPEELLEMKGHGLPTDSVRKGLRPNGLFDAAPVPVGRPDAHSC